MLTLRVQTADSADLPASSSRVEVRRVEAAPGLEALRTCELTAAHVEWGSGCRADPEELADALRAVPHVTGLDVTERARAHSHY